MSNFLKQEANVVAENNGFLNKITIKNRVNLLIIFSLIFFFIFSTSFFIWFFQRSMYEQKTKQISIVTESAINLLKEYKIRADKGEFSEQEAQKRAINRINTLKFDGNNYIWINDYDYKFLAHPAKQGQDGSGMEDKNGFKVIAEATKVAQEKGEGTVKYFWNKPEKDTKLTFLKISYVRNFPEWGWIVGAGIYVDDIQNEINEIIIKNLVLNIFLLLLITVIGNNTIGKSIVKPIEKLINLSLQLAENNLAVKIPEDTNKTEIGELNRSFKKFVENFSGLIKQVVDSTEDISASAEEMSASSEQTAQGAQQTATSTAQLAQGAQEISRNVEQGAVNINKMNKAIQGVSEEAKQVAQLGNDSEANANEGAEYVKKAVNKIDSIKKVSEDISVNISELGKLSSEIEQIVDLIKNIAGQTNLLALNAAIEAARAGEHGKGFAVVADEVKKLAGQSAGATEKITTMIKEIQNKTNIAVTTMNKATTEVEEGVFVINDAGKALESIIMQAKSANIKIQGITKEIDGVARNSEDMVKMIENISAITEETAASAEEISSITEEQTASLEEISASAQTLAKIAEKLTGQVSVFKI